MLNFQILIKLSYQSLICMLRKKKYFRENNAIFMNETLRKAIMTRRNLRSKFLEEKRKSQKTYKTNKEYLCQSFTKIGERIFFLT